MSKAAIDLTGQVFGRLVVLARVHKAVAAGERQQVWWRTRCSCGKEKEVMARLLRNGGVRSCGCLALEVHRTANLTHGMTNSFEFKAWTAMRKRCSYKKHPAYHRYGERGIKVCERWQKFEAFLEDMGLCPFANGSIERRDNSKGYSPDNCVWLSKTEQAKNRSNVPQFNGLTLPDLAAKHGVKYTTLKRRIKAKWPEEKWFKSPQELGTRK